jgi:hypothetical protein
MILLLPLLRKLSIRSRTILGTMLAAAGLIALVIGLAAVPSIVVDAIIAAVIGAIFLGSAWSSRRRALAGGAAVIR